MTSAARRRPIAALGAAALVAAVIGSVTAVSLAAGEAAPLPDTITIDDALRFLRDRSPGFAADRAQIDVAQADVVAAGVYPNPNLSLGRTKLYSGQSTGAITSDQISIDQPLLIFGQLGQRRRYAHSGLDLAQAQVAASFAGRAYAVRQQFVELLTRQEYVRLYGAARDDLARIRKIIEGRASAGDKSRYDVLRIQVEERTLTAKLNDAIADATDAAGQLATLLGVPGWHPTASGDLAPADIGPLDADALWARAQTQRPELAAARKNEILAQEGIRLAKRERIPVPSVQAGEDTTTDVAGHSWIAGLSLSLPIFDRGQGPIARATAQAHLATLQRESTAASVHADIERALTVLRQRRELLEKLEGEVIVHLPDLRSMAEKAYQEGAGDILELFDALRSLNEVQLTHVEQQAAAKKAEIDVQYLAGILDAN